MQPTHLLRRKLATGALVTLLSVAAIAMTVTSMRAHEGHDHGTTAAGEYKLPSDAWKSAQASLKAIEVAAAAKQHEPIHNEQEKLVTALKHILNHAEGAADKARLDGAIKNAITASEKVHTAADAKDFAKVDSSLKTLQATMTLVEKQLPAGAK